MLKPVVNLLKALNSNSNPNQIASAVCCGMMLGVMPKTNVTWYILTVFFLFFRNKKPALVISTLLFSFLAPHLDSVFDTVGYYILTIPSLKSFYRFFFDIPFITFTHLDHTIVIGSLIISLILFIPMFFIIKLFVKLWRTKLTPIIRKTKLMTVISKLPLVQKIGALS